MVVPPSVSCCCFFFQLNESSFFQKKKYEKENFQKGLLFTKKKGMNPFFSEKEKRKSSLFRIGSFKNYTSKTALNFNIPFNLATSCRWPKRPASVSFLKKNDKNAKQDFISLSSKEERKREEKGRSKRKVKITPSQLLLLLMRAFFFFFHFYKKKGRRSPVFLGHVAEMIKLEKKNLKA